MTQVGGCSEGVFHLLTERIIVVVTSKGMPATHSAHAATQARLNCFRGSQHARKYSNNPADEQFSSGMQVL